MIASAGCIGAGSQENDAVAAAPVPEANVEFDSSLAPTPGEVIRDQAAWTLPTDRYSPTSAYRLSGFAFGLATASCMYAAGFDQYVVREDISAPGRETDAGYGGGSSRLNSSLAAKYGYRMSPDPSDRLDGKIPAGSWYYESEPADFRAKLEECEEAAHVEVYGEDSSEEAAASDVILDESDTVGSQLNRLQPDWSSPELIAAAASWRACMAPLGIADLPERPWEPGTFPPESLVEEWDWWTIGEPSADEVKVATSDANCRESSGWFSALYEAEWNLREAFVAEHQAELASIIEDNEEEARHAIEVINKYGGSSG